jgi:hypothetical protein
MVVIAWLLLSSIPYCIICEVVLTARGQKGKGVYLLQKSFSWVLDKHDQGR